MLVSTQEKKHTAKAEIINGKEVADEKAPLPTDESSVRTIKKLKESQDQLERTITQDETDYKERFEALDASVDALFAASRKAETVIDDLEKSLNLITTESDRIAVSTNLAEAHTELYEILSQQPEYEDQFLQGNPNFESARTMLEKMKPMINQQTELIDNVQNQKAIESQQAQNLLRIIGITTIGAHILNNLEKSSLRKESEQAQVIDKIASASERLVTSIAKIQITLEGTNQIPQTLENILNDLTTLKLDIESHSQFLNQKLMICNASREDLLQKYKQIKSKILELAQRS